jgi:tRNA-2-methylthio-N6-dimethylallyladenosine synthase
MPYLHLPIQAGSDAVLKKMNRKHTAAEYIDIIHRLRAARPDIALSSDFIVGFPAETDQDFDDTMRLVETVGYASAYSFKYSPRPGTPAAEVEVQLPEEVKAERLQRLQNLLNRQQRAFNQSTVGKIFPILLERPGKHEGQMIGKSPYLQSVHVSAPQDQLGRLVNVRITHAYDNSLAAEIVL